MSVAPGSHPTVLHLGFEGQGRSSMKGSKTAIGRFVFFNGYIVGIALLVGLCPAQVSGSTQIEIIPPQPTPSDNITIKLFDTWGNDCVPIDPQVEVRGSEIHIATFIPREICSEIITPWVLLVPIGQFPAGMYHVIVTYSTPSNVARPIVIGEADFSVQPLADISGCIRLQGAPLVEQQVILKQRGERRQTTTTDAGGCFTLNEPVPGRPFQILIKSPEGP